MENFQELDIVKSALTCENPFNSTEDILSWVEVQKKSIDISIDPIKFDELKKWYFQEESGNLVHETGKFFSIEGIDVKTNWGFVEEWQQPIINQPEVGVLGIICKKFNNILYFLLQAKVEPGNINFVQLSPTVQATRSNFTQVHKGEKPKYIEYFQKHPNVKILLDQLQSEQGARFLRKRNRNMIVELEGDIELYPNFCWVTLGQIKQLLLYDNLVNMDTRSVISCISYGMEPEVEQQSLISKVEPLNPFNHQLFLSAIATGKALHSFKSIFSWITNLKAYFDLSVERIPLKKVEKWHRDEYSIYHEDHKYFSVIAVNVTIGNREVKSWTQPVLKASQVGIMAFIIKKINGVYHFLVQAKLEPGNLDIVELAPTVQCLTDNYRYSVEERKPAFLDFILNVNPSQIRYDTHQSEEGGRFYKEENRNMIIEVGDEFPTEVPEQYIWMTLNQITTFIQFNNYFNIEARSIIAAISFI